MLSLLSDNQVHFNNVGLFNLYQGHSLYDVKII